MSFAQRLKAARERRDFSQVQLVNLAGIDQAQLSHYEGGRREPSADNLRKLARALDIRADFLLELTNDTSRIGVKP